MISLDDDIDFEIKGFTFFSGSEFICYEWLLLMSPNYSLLIYVSTTNVTTYSFLHQSYQFIF